MLEKKGLNDPSLSIIPISVIGSEGADVHSGYVAIWNGQQLISKADRATCPASAFQQMIPYTFCIYDHRAKKYSSSGKKKFSIDMANIPTADQTYEQHDEQ